MALAAFLRLPLVIRVSAPEATATAFSMLRGIRR